MPKSRGRKRPKKLQLSKMPLQLRDALLEQRAAFRAKFGRDPGPNDPILFDPNKDVPTPIGLADLEGEVLGAMRKTGVPPEIIYAYRKTGRLRLHCAPSNLTWGQVPGSFGAYRESEGHSLCSPSYSFRPTYSAHSRS
jgi:hypothetical protein